MQQNTFIDGIYNISNWILRFTYLNFLWILFSLLGLLVGGLFPSTVSMFTVVRKWILNKSSVPIYETFLKTYKTNFIRSNILGYSLSFIGLVLYADFLFLRNVDTYLFQLLYIPVLVISFLYITTLLYVLPIFVHYELKGIELLKNAFFLSIISPFSTLKMCLGLLLLWYLMITFPGSIILFSGSMTSYIIMRTANTAFLQHELKRKNTSFNNIENTK
jgi:uncharacterized membrane protein YesL